VKTTIDHFGKKLENVSSAKVDHAPTVNLGHTQHPSQSLAENNRKGSFCCSQHDMRKGIKRARLCADGRNRRRRNVPFWMKNCQILSNVVCEDFVACNIRVDSEFCLTRAEKGLWNKFNSQLKYRFRGMNRKI
jgi:hypothetical protein